MNMNIPIIGGIISCLGLVFHLQGISILGPESSFMYSNQEWVSYGLYIILVGIAVFSIGIIIKIRTKNKINEH